MEKKLDEKKVFEQYINYHGDKFNQLGFDSKVVWNRKESQLMRFEVLAKMFKTKENFSVIDIGCGLADFYFYMEQNGYSNINYIGYEINEAMVGAIKSNHPTLNIQLGSYPEIMSMNQNFDYVNACGIHAFGESAEEVQNYFFEKYTALYQKTNVAMGINFLSVYSKNPDNMSIYHDPSVLLKRSLDTFGHKVSLYHNYLPNDFTLIIEK